MNKKLERKRFRLKNDEGELIGDITAISMVSQPAIEKDFQLFNSVPKKSNFKVTNEDKMEVTGPVMVPNQDILRFDDTNKEYYYCYFTEQDVKDYSEFYLKESNHTKANFEHGDEFTSEFFICESWIVVDPENDKSKALGFKDIPAGTWFATYKTYNVDLWNKVKESNLAGFSVEISLNDFKKAEQEIEKDIEDIVDDLFLSKQDKIEAIEDIVLVHDFFQVNELSFADYPEAAVLNAKKALEYKVTNPDSNCGNKLMWSRCKQIATRQPLSYSTLKRISLSLKNEAKANAAAYDYGCAKLMWDAFGGTDLIYWSCQKLQQIEALVQDEAKKLIPEKKSIFPFR